MGGISRLCQATGFSNHAPVILRTFGQSEMAAIQFRIPEKVMLDDQWYIQVRDIWRRKDNMDAPISIKVACDLTRLSQYFALKSRSEYMEYQEKERRMRATLISLQRLQQGRPECAWVALHLEAARKQVQHMEE